MSVELPPEIDALFSLKEIQLSTNALLSCIEDPEDLLRTSPHYLTRLTQRIRENLIEVEAFIETLNQE